MNPIKQCGIFTCRIVVTSYGPFRPLDSRLTAGTLDEGPNISGPSLPSTRLPGCAGCSPSAASYPRSIRLQAPPSVCMEAGSLVKSIRSAPSDQPSGAFPTYPFGVVGSLLCSVLIKKHAKIRQSIFYIKQVKIIAPK